MAKTDLGSFSSRGEREKHIVDFVMTTIRCAEHETAPDRKRWKENEELFAGKQDWGADRENEDWRAKLFIHEYAPIIREAATAAQNQIFARADFINLIADKAGNKEFAEILMKLVKHYLEEMGFRQTFYEWVLVGGIYGFATWKLPVVNKLEWRPDVIIERIQKESAESLSGVRAENVDKFLLPDSLDEVVKGMEDAYQSLMGGGKPTFASPAVKPKKRLELGFELTVMNPFNFFWQGDVTHPNRSPWHAERTSVKFAELIPHFEAGTLDKTKKRWLLQNSGSMPLGTYDSTDSYSQQKIRQRDQMIHPNPYFPTCELTEYFGPLPGRDGDILEENCHFIIGNGRYLLKDGKNGYWDQKSPYWSTVFNPRPFKPGGAGIGDGAVATQKFINEFTSMLVDALHMDIYSPLGVNIDMIADKSQIEGGVRPGEYIHLYNGSARDAFTELPKSSNDADKLFQTMEYLKLSGQKSAAVNTMSSNPSSRARISAKEVQSNDSRRLESLNTLSMAIDVSGLEPLVERTKRLIIQFGFTNDNLELLASKGILTSSEYEMVNGMTIRERFLESTRNFKTEVRGFRAAMERDQHLARFNEWTNQLTVMPPQAVDQIDWRNVVVDGTELYGLKGDRFIRAANDRDKAREENALLERGNAISTIPDDDDVAQLPIHYELLMKVGPSPSAAQHVMMHLQQAQMKGAQIPPPPPEVAAMLGLPPPVSPDAAKEQRAAQQISKEASGEKLVH